MSAPARTPVDGIMEEDEYWPPRILRHADVQAILAVEPDANVMLEHDRDVVGAARGPRTNGRAEVTRGWLRSWGSFFNQRKIAPISMISCPWRRTDPMQECFAVGRWFPGH